MFEYIIIGLLIVVIICLVYWICIRKSDTQLREDYNAALGKSVGVLDVGARTALHALANIRNPTPADHFTRGRTIFHHVAGGDLGTFTREDRRRIAAEINGAFGEALRAPGELGGMRVGLTTHMLTNMDMIRLGILAAGEIADDAMLRQIARDLGGNLGTHGAEARRQGAAERVAEAVATATNRGEAVDAAFNAATVFTDDRQNVHDSAVNGDLRAILNQIECAVVPSAAIEEARRYTDGAYPGDETKRARARQGLDTAMRAGNVSALGMTEDRVLALVWERAKHPLNEDNAADMREALIDSLADGVENGHQVCVNGRTSRMLASMTMLDFDETVANGVLTLEAYRNTIFQQSRDAVDNAIASAKESTNAQRRAIGESYESGDPLDINDPAAATFMGEIRKTIDDIASKYTEKMSQDELERVKAECYLYASI